MSLNFLPRLEIEVFGYPDLYITPRGKSDEAGNSDFGTVGVYLYLFGANLFIYIYYDS